MITHGVPPRTLLVDSVTLTFGRNFALAGGCVGTHPESLHAFCYDVLPALLPSSFGA